MEKIALLQHTKAAAQSYNEKGDITGYVVASREKREAVVNKALEAIEQLGD